MVPAIYCFWQEICPAPNITGLHRLCPALNWYWCSAGPIICTHMVIRNPDVRSFEHKCQNARVQNVYCDWHCNIIFYGWRGFSLKQYFPFKKEMLDRIYCCQCMQDLSLSPIDTAVLFIIGKPGYWWWCHNIGRDRGNFGHLMGDEVLESSRISMQL